MSSAAPLGAGPRVGPGVLLASASLMLTELVLTRIFSVVVWYHFAFFAISVALFGSAAAAIVVHTRPSAWTPSRTVGASLALAASIVLVDVALLHVAPDWFGAGGTATQHTQLTAKLLGLFLVTTLPFFCGGLVIASAMTENARVADRLYFADLGGAALACLCLPLLLQVLSGPIALVAAAILASGAGLAFADDRRSRVASFAGAFVALLVMIVGRPTGLLEVGLAKGISLDARTRELEKWNAFSMVAVLPQGSFRGWGTSPAYVGPAPTHKRVLIDMNAMTPVVAWSGATEDASWVSYDLSAFVYTARGPAERACVLGAGGGKDVIAALRAGASDVEAVEINPIIVQDVMQDRYAGFSGGLYRRPDVHAHVDDGRSFARRHPAHCDVVNISMVDTSAATAAGAYALTENSLYTSDAIDDFLSALRPGGVLSMASVNLPDLAVGPRLVSIARAAVRARGIDPKRAIAVLTSPWVGFPNARMYAVLVKPDGWTEEDAGRIEREARRLQFRALYVPGRAPVEDTPDAAAASRIVRSDDDVVLARTVAGWPLDLSPTTDDRPFFFYQNRIGDLRRLLASASPAHMFGNGLAIVGRVIAVSLVLVVVFLLGPAVLGARRAAGGAGRLAADLGYAACLGVGFMFVEMGLLTRLGVFLGHPTSTLAVVLVVLLAGGAFGSRWLASGDPGRVRKALGLAVAFVLVVAFTLGPVLRAAGALGLPARVALAAAIVAPIGVLLGAALPGALRALSLRAPDRVAWILAVNSATSVLGSALATVVSLHLGIAATLCAGATAYAAALLLSRAVLRDV